MPDYHSIPVIDKLKEVVKLHEKSPLSQEVARNAIGKILTSCSKLGIENAKQRLKYCEKAHADCKQTLATMERLLEELESPDYIPEIFKLEEVRAGLTIIRLTSDAVEEDGGTMFDLMSQYRASWGSTIQKVCEDISFVDAHIAVRTQTMTIGKQAVGHADRLKEYVKRAEQIVKQAEKARRGGEQTMQATIKEAEQLVVDIEESASAAAEVARKAEAKLRSLNSNKTAKVYTGKEHKIAESQVADLETDRKSVAGMYKTAEQFAKQFDKLYEAGEGNQAVLQKRKERKDAALESLKEHRNTMQEFVEEGNDTFDELKQRLGKK